MKYLDSNKILNGILLSAITGTFVFLWTINNRLTVIESKQDLSVRVSNLEDALLPVLVEYRLQKELEKLETKEKPTATPGVSFIPLTPFQDPIFRMNKKNALRNDAEKWANDQLDLSR